MGGPEGHKLTSHKLSGVKRFADQQALDVFPVLGHARRFSVIGQKTVDRFTLIKFYDVSKRLLEEDKVPFRSGHME